MSSIPTSRHTHISLSQHAIPREGTLGRIHKEPADGMRTPFQRDRDRVIHTQAFRRLQGKTQVFVTQAGDHFRTRLTHTLEVAQLSRDIARFLSLNEDTCECIALAHDLGHPPFGHAGEDALNEWMQEFGLSFEHNAQSFRIVTLLETHSSLFPGLNLNQEVLQGLLKHVTPHDQPLPSPSNTLSLEAQLVNIADEIAYSSHDSDDGLSEGLFSLQDITHIPLIKEAHEKRLSRGTSLRGALIQILIDDLLISAGKQNITFSSGMRSELSKLRTFLWDNMYLHPEVLNKANQGKKIVHALCASFHSSPPQKVQDLQKKFNCTKEEAIKDYVSGMTDRFAQSHGLTEEYTV
jgi:dGTPase